MAGFEIYWQITFLILGVVIIACNLGLMFVHEPQPSERKKSQAETESKVQLEKAKSQFEINRLQQEAEIKKVLMAQEFEYNMKLAELNAAGQARKENEIEDRKDKRIAMQGTQESKLIDQRKNDLLPTNFESTNDSLGGFDLEQFAPK